MSEVIVITVLGLVAVAPMAYLAVMAGAVKRSDNSEPALNGAR